MTYTERLREEFAKELDFISDHWIKGDDRPPFSFGGWRDECLDKFMEIVTTAIQQAVAEERARLVGEISALDGHYTNVTNEKDVYERGFAVGYDTGWNDVLLKLHTALLSPQQSNPNKNI